MCLQAQQRRILQLEAEAEAMRVESGSQQEALVQQRLQTRAAEARIQELQQELENNAGTTADRSTLLYGATRSTHCTISFLRVQQLTHVAPMSTTRQQH